MLRRSISPPRFADVASSAGLHYTWTIPGPRPLNILQTIGNGCAFLDFDNDGNLDILLVGPKLALYKGDGHGHFTDVTHQTGLDQLHGDFRGCAVGDYDNDGFDDLYISAYRGGVLLHNETDDGRRMTDGAGRVRQPSSVTRHFRDVTKAAGIAPQPWGTSCSFVDLDNDGRLDLFIGNYVQFGPKSKQLCDYLGVKAACPPGAYAPETDRVYRNVGGGRFQDVTKAWGFERAHGKALAVAAAPLSPGGRPSLAIANDAIPGDLMTLRGTTAVNTAVEAGTATLGDGIAYGGMGVDWGDYDNDGNLDLLVSTFRNQAKVIFRNLGGAFELESTEKLGMVESVPHVTFGAKWIDFDNDGWLDVLMANGHIQDNIEAVAIEKDPGSAYRQPTMLYHNLGGARFDDESGGLAGPAGRPIVGRGLAVGDYDNDGREDALVVDSEGAPLLLHNVTRPVGKWLSVKLEGVRCNRDGYGAIVQARVGTRTLTRLCHSDGSYASASDRRVHFGLGSGARVNSLTVTWPDGHIDRYTGVPANRFVSIREGDRRVSVLSRR